MIYRCDSPNEVFETKKKKTSGEMLTQTAADYIKAHYKEKFSLQKMADNLFVNESYLLRVFKKHTGYTLLAFHNHIRCKQAMELLAHTGEEISEIGEMVGFISSAHFSHVFKKAIGCTPSEYRISNRVYWEQKDTDQESV